MLSDSDFIKQSLALHLFFMRIMKEHSFFLEIGFTDKNNKLARQVDDFKIQFDRLLFEVVNLSNGIVSSAILRSGEVITPYTLDAELATQYLSGIRIRTNITEEEAGLTGSGLMQRNPVLEQRVFMINNEAIGLVSDLIRFKTNLLEDVLSCRIFTFNYPLLIDHLLREAKFYREMLQKLQNPEGMDLKRDILEQEIFWNRIMAEHAKFIRGLLDPSENDLIQIANNFGNEFDELTEEARDAMDSAIPVKEVTDDSLEATRELRNFKVQGTQGILACKIQSIIIPLLADHVLREANHYLRLLKEFNR